MIRTVSSRKITSDGVREGGVGKEGRVTESQRDREEMAAALEPESICYRNTLLRTEIAGNTLGWR